MGTTIVALATPRQKSALGIVRISGPESFEYTKRLFSKPLTFEGKRAVFVGNLSENGRFIDQVVLLAFKKPHSFTGEDTVEIVCHGSPLTEEEIIGSYLSLGAVQALPGEFSERAFINGKIDLIEAEGINDLINASTKASKSLASKATLGESSKLMEPLKKILGDAVASLEVGIDFPEYEKTNSDAIVNLGSLLSKAIAIVNGLFESGFKGKLIKDGVKVALVGKPNVGKSSILNELIGEDKAIVTPIAGTTRDVVEGEAIIGGILFRFYDTAGIRETNDDIEKIGIGKSLSAIENCDVVVSVSDDSCTETYSKPTIYIHSKSDLINEKEAGINYVSAKNHDIQKLKDLLLKYTGIAEDDCSKPSLTSDRQLGMLKKVLADLTEAKEGLVDGLTPDLISIPLQSAYRTCLAITGEDPTIDFETEVFSRFCVGK